MSTRYLLPCSCGKQMLIERAQAGLTLQCSCGQTLEVPTIRGFDALAQVDNAAPARPARAWGLRQSLVFLGLLIAVPALAFGTIRLLNVPPEHPDYEIDVAFNQQQVESLTVEQLLELWDSLNIGLDPSAVDPQMILYGTLRQQFIRWTWVILGLGVAGLVVAGGGFMWPEAA